MSLVGQVITDHNNGSRYRIDAQDGITLTITSLTTGKQSAAYLLGTFICFEVEA